jgi:hypothetical protein
MIAATCPDDSRRLVLLTEKQTRALLDGDLAQGAGPTTRGGLYARELFAAKPLGHATGEQQPIESALVLGQHAVRRARGESDSHQTELAGAVTRDGIYQIK